MTHFDISDAKIIKLKFESDTTEESKKSGEYNKNLNFSTYTVTLNASGQLSVNDDELNNK